jgi:hypothetical protein
MAIPQHLDTFVLGDRKVTPEVEVNPQTMEAEIHVQLTDTKTGALIEGKTFKDEGEYLEYVKSLIGN